MSLVRFLCSHCGAANECAPKEFHCPNLRNSDEFKTSANCAHCRQSTSWSAYSVDDLVAKNIVFRYTPVAPLPLRPGV